MSPTAGLPGLAVARPISVLMSLAALLVVGVIAQRALPVQLLPTGFDPPFLWVWVPTLPAAPADNERDVAIPVEDALATMPGLASFRSAVRADAVNFRLELSNETDVDSAYQQVRDRLDRVTPTLPEGAQRGYIWRHDPNGRPVAIYGVVYPPGTEDPHEVLDRKIGRAIERLPGVSSVELWGVPERQVRVEIDDGAARAHGVDLGQLARKLGADNFTLALGAIEPGGRRSLVRALSRFSDLETLRALPVAEGVTLADVATVHFAPDPEPVINRIDGRNAATLAIFKESTANTIEVSALVAARLDALMTTDPELQGYESTPFFDQGAYIDRSIDELQTSALIGGLIAVALLFAFLRSVGMTFIVSVAIPLCLLSTLIVLYFNGDSLDVMSMMGLMLSVGMVIDNAIVVLENIDRHRALGSPIPSVSGAREVSLAITLATLTTMVVFLPLILLGGEPMLSFYLGKIGFPVCYALGASLFVALVYIPAGAHALGRRTGRKPTASSFRWLQTLYARQLGWALRHRTAAALLLIIAVASTAWPFERIERVDRLDAGLDSVSVRINGPAAGTLEDLDDTLQRAEKALLADKSKLDIRAVQARRGWRPNMGLIEVYLVEPADRHLTRTEMDKEVLARMPERPGYEVKIGWGGNDDTNTSGLTLSLMGPDTQVASALAEELLPRLAALPGATQAEIETEEPASELRFEVDRDRAERAGVSPRQVGGTLDYLLRGRRLGEFHTEARTVDLLLELAPGDREDVEQVGHMPVRPLNASADDPDADPGAPIAQISRARLVPGYGEIRREERKSVVSIRVNGDEKSLFGELQRVTAGVSLPPGYHLDLGARFRMRNRNEAGGAFALVLAVAMVFFLMGVLFESFILPFSILLTIPLAFCGVFWTLYLTGTPLDIMAIVGCIILVGVVVNNGIVLIDQVQHRRTEGSGRTEALVETGRDRVRPILMTALTTIGGLIPMAVGNASLLGIEYAPLGRVVIGGLLTGTALTLFGVPLFYSLLDDARHLPRRARLLFTRRAPAAEVVVEG